MNVVKLERGNCGLYEGTVLTFTCIVLDCDEI